MSLDRSQDMIGHCITLRQRTYLQWEEISATVESERVPRVVWYSLMVSICKYMVSRRFTTAVQLSAEIMQQRTYEVSWFGVVLLLRRLRSNRDFNFVAQICKAVGRSWLLFWTCTHRVNSTKHLWRDLMTLFEGCCEETKLSSNECSSPGANPQNTGKAGTE